MTILEVIRATTGYFEKRGIESPRLNAEHLLAHSLGKRRLDLYLEFDRPLSEADRAPLRDLVRQRGEGVPLQHLLGTVEFLGREFLSDSRALIPRPETEQLVEIAISGLPEGPITLLDVGTGSGVIAISLALSRPESRVHATDLSAEALELARSNAARHGANVAFHHGDLWPESSDVRFHAVVANLPYIPTGEIPALQREVRHDPTAALDGGTDGLDLVRRLIGTASNHLQPHAFLALELGHDQAEQVGSILADNGFDNIQIYKDLSEVPRFVTAHTM